MENKIVQYLCRWTFLKSDDIGNVKSGVMSEDRKARDDRSTQPVSPTNTFHQSLSYILKNSLNLQRISRG